MSDSAHTYPPKIQARGRTVVPRLVERRPYPGDVVPIGKKRLRGLVRTIPPQYIYGLKTIEFLPRRGEIGMPYGQYSCDEKRILLFSLPLVWENYPLSESFQEHMPSWGAEITASPTEEGRFTVRWPDERLLSIWFFDLVFLHELGHHYTKQYERKNGSYYKTSIAKHEALANFHRDFRLLWNRDKHF